LIIGTLYYCGTNPTLEVVANENKVRIIDHEFGNLIEKNVDDCI